MTTYLSKGIANRPCAGPGLDSYRYLGRYGWIMIGARDDEDALREAGRSISSGKPDLAKLERWTPAGYVRVE